MPADLHAAHCACRRCCGPHPSDPLFRRLILAIGAVLARFT